MLIAGDSMPTLNVSLSEHFSRMIGSGIKDGRFLNASDAVESGLRLLEEQGTAYHAKVAWLRDAVQDGIDELDRGEGLPFDSMDDLKAHLRHLGDEASCEVANERRD